MSIGLLTDPFARDFLHELLKLAILIPKSMVNLLNHGSLRRVTYFNNENYLTIFRVE